MQLRAGDIETTHDGFDWLATLQCSTNKQHRIFPHDRGEVRLLTSEAAHDRFYKRLGHVLTDADVSLHRAQDTFAQLLG
ncbi:hypothetical protein A7D35_02745 [Xanthomonas arboricola]|nr:hypothetical protein A7D35_02745 [Xanthomonas arboricola]